MATNLNPTEPIRINGYEYQGARDGFWKYRLIEGTPITYSIEGNKEIFFDFTDKTIVGGENFDVIKGTIDTKGRYRPFTLTSVVDEPPSINLNPTEPIRINGYEYQGARDGFWKYRLIKDVPITYSIEGNKEIFFDFTDKTIIGGENFDVIKGTIDTKGHYRPFTLTSVVDEPPPINLKNKPRPEYNQTTLKRSGGGSRKRRGRRATIKRRKRRSTIKRR